MSQNLAVIKEIERRVIEVISPGPQGPAGSGSSGVSKIIAGTNVSISPTGGTGDVTINSSGSGSGTVTSVSGGTALTVTGNANVSPTINHDAFGTASSYAHPASITTNATGHIIAATPGSLPLLPANNLSEVDAASARSNLGVPATNHSHSAGNIISGILDVARVPDLAASKINSGVLDAARIPTLTTGSISGLGSSATLDVPSSGNALSGEVVKGNDSRLTDARTPVSHSATLVTSGTLGVDRIPSLSTDKLTSGTLAVARGGTGSATAPMVGVITAANAAAARATLGVTNTGSYTGQIETAIDNKTYTIDPRVVVGRTIASFYARSGAGTCTATLKNDTATVGVVSVTTNSTTAVISNASVSDGDPITLLISSNQSATDVVFSVEYTQ